MAMASSCSPLVAVLVALLLVAATVPAPCAAVDPVNTYCARNLSGAPAQASVAQNATDPEAFEKAQRKVMARVAADAGDAGGGGLARETARFKDGVTIYGLGWCTRDITAADCGLCVAQAVAEMPNYCRFRRGCRVLYSSCMARYETYPFFFPLDGGQSADASASAAGDYDRVVLNP
ncbi:hypothetical protein OsJ_16871 [Oryza sativa Japonica Group]|uniref:Gnk2-homologous domain-containing protein n=1 Tax=Oryza sativa subsp. japonica TaxID=39947 RepID=B9FKB4_ORYSJ|nr:hypothetical protein OsJ_16871 [Oryza sativa Japonica Group]